MKLYAAPLDFRPIAGEFSVPTDFPEEVTAQAASAQDRYADQRRDARDIPLVTIDPVGSMDLDQAVFIEARDGGYRVLYAIADVAAFIEPGSALEEESLKRGQTIYLPDEPARLHPAELSEDRASLLADVDRPAVLWTFDLDSAGEVEDFSVERALVRNRARLDYDQVHEDLENGSLHSSIALLPEVGKLRQASSLRRDAINLRLPSQRVQESSDEGEGHFELVMEPRYEVMDYNSEISLLTGMCAGRLMESHGIGFLRTLAAATPEAEAEFRSEAQALGFSLEGQSISEFLHSVDADSPRGMAVMREAQRLLRGADYVWLEESPADVHAGIGGYYAHVTAPLRRLVDRFATEVCLALSGGYEVPEWVRNRAGDVIASMRSTSQLASQVDRACLNLTEATVLAPWVGTNFESVVVDGGEKRDKARLFILEPPVMGEAVGQPPTGSETTVSLVKADVAERDVLFAWPAD
ncbi:ribonuclease catalytic domain-containing protein [Corynebacterium minutissimum]|uniref:RNB domain-containing ribonuclease n=1 Tax=Corynebacterium minutissimum TaxID=38301 RepID=A0A2X4RBQ2_9CORY|nr:RNB domain-containing ribonuclease [Corynebacterium minutissimum]KHO29196.1 exoribonuclease [Corynebacterium minutissimum]QPS59350.1 RNB domain-containing ribonuclease [Corynebacterium minutissimum]QQA79861.1 RNB domain-containing ribonuclease [Corynebacterium minutissimum]SQH99293.1 ribonuclease R [Corynebacterium minutissimum]VEG06478.1 ribonuclease R [Corynebacterium minutissimum]